MSTMTLEQALELGYRAGFISACNWPQPCSQDVDSPSFAIELRGFIEKHTPLTRQPEVSEGDVRTACRSAYPNWEKFTQSERESFKKDVRAALTAVWHNRPAQETCSACDGTGRVESTDGGVWGGCYKCGKQAREKAEPVAIEGERVDLLASYLDDGGHHGEADNVRNGTDLESYEVEFRLIDWILRHCKAPPAERVRVPE